MLYFSSFRGGWLRFDGSIRTEHKTHSLVKQSAKGGEERVFPAVLLICGSVSHLPIPWGGGRYVKQGGEGEG